MLLPFGSGNICSVGLELNRMSLALQLTPETDTETENVSDAEDAVDSSADLVAMFPSLDHEVAVMVLEAHSGHIEAAVEYLMSTNGEGGPTQPSVTGYSRLDPAYDMVGQFSADIGGLPEVLPRCLYDDFTPGRREEEEEEEEGEGEDGSSGGAQASGNPVEIGSEYLPEEGTLSWLAENDPLPTYSEACRGPSVYTPVDSSLPGSEASGDDHSSLKASGAQGSPGHSSSGKKKGKKLFKIASKLNPRKKSVGKYKVVQEKYGSGDGQARSQQYQPLIDDDELQEENS